MTVAELIEVLSKMPQDAVVVYREDIESFDGDWFLGHVTHDDEVNRVYFEGDD